MRFAFACQGRDGMGRLPIMPQKGSKSKPAKRMKKAHDLTVVGLHNF
jgi:hypothetical protein